MKDHLYKIFADKWNKGGTLYFYSDPHFGDEEMKTYRKNYISDDEQVKRINSKVGKKDTIVFLGDIGDINYIKKIKGYKVLIMGNHDKGASNYKRDYGTSHLEKIVLKNHTCYGPGQYSDAYDYTRIQDTPDNHLFDEVYEGPLMISDRILLSHEPIPLPYVLNIHGHDHSNKESVSPHHLNMCAEHIDYTPVMFKDIVHSGILKDVPSIHRFTIDKRK